MFDGVLFLVGWCCGGLALYGAYFWLCAVSVAGWWAWCFWFVRLLLGLVLVDVVPGFAVLLGLGFALGCWLVGYFDLVNCLLVLCGWLDLVFGVGLRVY